jgi:hypothetical protein
MATKNVTHAAKGFNASFDDETMERMEAGANSKERGQQRRIALLLCARDCPTILKLAKESPETFEEMAELAIEFHKHAQALLDVATSAFARIAMVEELRQAA